MAWFATKTGSSTFYEKEMFLKPPDEMGKLSRKMPLTMAYFVIGGLALAGIPPLSGFFSKDAILFELYNTGHGIAFWVLMITAGLTAFYMGRAFFVVFTVVVVEDTAWAIVIFGIVVAALTVVR